MGRGVALWKFTPELASLCHHCLPRSPGGPLGEERGFSAYSEEGVSFDEFFCVLGTKTRPPELTSLHPSSLLSILPVSGDDDEDAGHRSTLPKMVHWILATISQGDDYCPISQRIKLGAVTSLTSVTWRVRAGSSRGHQLPESRQLTDPSSPARQREGCPTKPCCGKC